LRKLTAPIVKGAVIQAFLLVVASRSLKEQFGAALV
jgi:hypothetical protein